MIPFYVNINSIPMKNITLKIREKNIVLYCCKSGLMNDSWHGALGSLV